MTAQAIAVNVTDTGVVSATPCTYRGLSLRDDSGAANTVTLYDNATEASGTVLAAFQLDSGAPALDNVADGVRAEHGLWLECTGAVVGSVRVG